MSDVKLQKFISKRGWRGYNGEKVLKIREQYPDIDPYLHTEIVLDWISAKKPKQEVVSGEKLFMFILLLDITVPLQLLFYYSRSPNCRFNLSF